MSEEKEKTNKAEAIRDAIAEMGGDPKPTAVVEHLKKKGIDVSANYVSMEKSKIREAGESAVLAVSPPAPAASKKAAKPAASSNVIDIILTTRQLILDLGSKEELKRLIDAL